MQANGKRFRIQFYVLILVTALPVLMGWALYHFHDSFHLNTTNRGTFINPPLEVNYLIKPAEKKWQVIYVSSNTCDAHCQLLNHQLLQLQTALGKNYNRVLVRELKESDSIAQQLQLSFTKSPTHLMVANKVFLVDPIGNLFMYYLDSVDPMDILKDLKKVLEVSQIG